MKTSIFFSAILLLLISCESRTLDQQLDSWCACQKQSAEQPEIKDSCEQIMTEITDEFAYDPDALPVIERAVSSCE